VVSGRHLGGWPVQLMRLEPVSLQGAIALLDHHEFPVGLSCELIDLGPERPQARYAYRRMHS